MYNFVSNVWCSLMRPLTRKTEGLLLPLSDCRRSKNVMRLSLTRKGVNKTVNAFPSMFYQFMFHLITGRERFSSYLSQIKPTTVV